MVWITASKNRSSGGVGASDDVLSGNYAVGQILDVTPGSTITTGNSFADLR